jgi:multidrug efflux pump subunit AcrB
LTPATDGEGRRTGPTSVEDFETDLRLDDDRCHEAICLPFALGGVWLRGMDNNLITQISFVVLIGLAAKNAVLIVEFAKQKEEEGLSAFEAAVEACRLRLRPIVMTSFAFILGVLPLAWAVGPGYEMRRVLGTTVFSGMLGVTLFGLFLTPAFYVTLRTLTGRRRRALPARETSANTAY